MKSAKEFERILLETIDEGMVQVFGNTPTGVIYDFIKGNYDLRKEDIPENLEIFSSSLEKTFGFGAILLEKLVLKKLYMKLGLRYDEKEGYKFLDYIKELKSQIILDYMKEIRVKSVRTSFSLAKRRLSSIMDRIIPGNQIEGPK